MNPRVNLLDPLKCNKCGICLEECKKIHDVSRIRVVAGIPKVCKQCKDAPCLKSCKLNAIYSKNNILIVDENICVGCGICAEICPYNNIIIKDLLAIKCTLCFESDNIIPGCLKCPERILIIESLKEE